MDDLSETEEGEERTGEEQRGERRDCFDLSCLSEWCGWNSSGRFWRWEDDGDTLVSKPISKR